MHTKSKKILSEIFSRLSVHYGPQHWWPAESPWEVMVGAILTQNTNWGNVERAIDRLKSSDSLDFSKMRGMPPAELAELIRPAGYFRLKAQRLLHLIEFIQTRYQGSIAAMAATPTDVLRRELLGVKGIGPETADSMLLYALERLSFVIDTYTHRVLTRHFVMPEESSYHELQDFIARNMEAKMEHFNEFHALFVAVGKEFCRPRPKCENCPLRGVNWKDKESMDFGAED